MAKAKYISFEVFPLNGLHIILELFMMLFIKKKKSIPLKMVH